MEQNQVYKMDAIGFLSQIDDGIIDMILCDLPYGTTNLKWDCLIDLDKLWQQYERIIKENGVIVLTASQPFTSQLVMSNPKMFRYEFIWIKTKPTGFQNARKIPLKRHENILVFYKKLPKFNQLQISKLRNPVKSGRKNKGSNLMENLKLEQEYYLDETGFQDSILEFANPSGDGHLHPTQKPIDLFRYLIQVFTDENDLVVDNCVGSGTTAVACKQTNRRYLCCDNELDFVNITNHRLRQSTVTTFWSNDTHNKDLTEFQK